MADIRESLALGRKYHQAGELHQAERMYRQILQVVPDHAETLCLLAAVCQGLGRVEEALAIYRQVLQVQPDFAWAHNNLGVLQAQLGRLEEARTSFEQALRAHPGFAEAHNNLGNTLRDQGQPTAALACYEEALRLKPSHADAHNNLGVLLAAQNRLDEAIASYQQALRINPNFAEAHNNLGSAQRDRGLLDQALASCLQALKLRPGYAEAHNNLGVTLARQGKLDEAVASYQQALSLNPRYAEAHNNLGTALQRLGQYSLAVTSFQEALRLRPDYAEAHNNLGVTLEVLDRYEEAVASYEQALRLNPDSAESHNNLGVALLAQARLDEAISCFDYAVRLQPDYARAHRNRACAWLLRGDWERGWREYEWRRRCPDYPVSPYRQPLWDGAPLLGRTILLTVEPLLADTLQFIRYAPLVKQHGGNVVLECTEPLRGLLRRCLGIDQLITRGSTIPDFDLQAPLASLPGILGTTPATVPTQVPYLLADAGRVEHWRQKMGFLDEMKIGLAWQDSSAVPGERRQSPALADFAPLGALPGVRLFSLQTDGAPTGALANRLAMTDLGSQLDEATGKLMDLAAVLRNLDLVICADTTVAHLAGALGVPVWVVLPLVPDWRWLVEREDSPWYPTMRLFRQTHPGEWSEVFQHIAAEVQKPLGAVAPGQRRCQSVLIEAAPAELIDRITILEIRQQHQPGKATRSQLEALTAARDRAMDSSAELDRLTGELRSANETLWRFNDELFQCEQAGDFGPRFVELARSVYRWNDHRAVLKRRINELLGSRLMEEKLLRSHEMPANEGLAQESIDQSRDR